MKWRSYLIFGLLSLVVSALSVVLWMINPFTDLLLLLAAPPLRLLGYHPPVGRVPCVINRSHIELIERYFRVPIELRDRIRDQPVLREEDQIVGVHAIV